MQKRISNCLFIFYLLLSVLVLCSCSSKSSTNSAAVQDTRKLCEATRCKSEACEGYNYCEAHVRSTGVKMPPRFVGENIAKSICVQEKGAAILAQRGAPCVPRTMIRINLCEAESCTSLKITGEKYCLGHKAGYTCSYWNCKNEAKEGSYFCAEHQSMQCKYENCHDPVGSLSDYKNTNYCSYHGCHYPDCNEKSNGNLLFGYCDYHEKVRLENSSAVFNNNYVQDTATMGEKNALKKAQDYLAFTAFSYTGLIDQLEFEGYTYQEALYGVNNCGADWNEQAAKKAAQYLEYMAFSRQGLIEQLEFEGFTYEQAVYGVTQNGY